MKHLIILFLAFTFAGCMTVNRIKNHCADFAKICVDDSKTDIRYRDTTIFINQKIYVDRIIKVPVPGFRDSIRIRDSVRIVDGQPFMKSIHRTQGLIAVDASVYRSIFSVNAYLTDSSILYNDKYVLTHQDSITIYNAIQKITITDTIVLPPVKYIPKFYKFLLWLFISELLALAIFIIWLIKGAWFRNLLEKTNRI